MARKNNIREKKVETGNLKQQRKRYCYFCKENIDTIDYKNMGMLERYISDKGKIRPRRSSGNCVQHQRKVAMAIKRARVLALIPYYKR